MGFPATRHIIKSEISQTRTSRCVINSQVVFTTFIEMWRMIWCDILQTSVIKTMTSKITFKLVNVTIGDIFASGQGFAAKECDK